VKPPDHTSRKTTGATPGIPAPEAIPAPASGPHPAVRGWRLTDEEDAMPDIDARTVARLRGFDTPTICNVIELFDVRPRSAGYMDARIMADAPELPPMVGFAATATFRASMPPLGAAVYARVAEQVERFGELPGPAVVVFQDLDDPSVAATFGEVMCSVYRAFGAAGLVTSGTGRDLDQVRALAFPTFTAGTACSHGYAHIPDIGVPVHVGGLVVHPGDLLHGDRNGVTSIPLEVASEVADASSAYMDAEEPVLAAMRSERATIEALREAQAESQARVRALRAELGRGG
jgi:4-hydroxy-4-methyl-2-oxoglutarate aldolase